MRSNLIYFDGEYYEYYAREKKQQGLSIGVYESSFLADLVTSYILVRYKNLFFLKIYHKIYRYNELALLKGKRSVQ